MTPTSRRSCSAASAPASTAFAPCCAITRAAGASIAGKSCAARAASITSSRGRAIPSISATTWSSRTTAATRRSATSSRIPRTSSAGSAVTWNAPASSRSASPRLRYHTTGALPRDRLVGLRAGRSRGCARVDRRGSLRALGRKLARRARPVRRAPCASSPSLRRRSIGQSRLFPRNVGRWNVAWLNEQVRRNRDASPQISPFGLVRKRPMF